MHLAADRWRWERAVDRVAVVDEVLADYATFVGRAYRRVEVPPLESAVGVTGVTWSIDGDVLVEYLVEGAGGRLLVHDVALLQPLRRVLRTRHVRIAHHAAGW